MRTGNGLDMIHVAAYPEGLALLCGRCLEQVMPPAPGLHTLAQLIEAAVRHVRDVHRPDISTTEVRESDFLPLCEHHGQPMVRGMDGWVCVCSLGGVDQRGPTAAPRDVRASPTGTPWPADFSRTGDPRTPAPCPPPPPEPTANDSARPITIRDDPARCRLMPTRRCPLATGAVGCDLLGPCARLESDDPTPWENDHSFCIAADRPCGVRCPVASRP